MVSVSPDVDREGSSGLPARRQRPRPDHCYETLKLAHSESVVTNLKLKRRGENAAAPPAGSFVETDALIERQRLRLTVPFLRSSSAACSGVGDTRFAHATVRRAVPAACPECAGREAAPCGSTCVPTPTETPTKRGSVTRCDGQGISRGNGSGSRASPGGRPGAALPRVRGALDQADRRPPRTLPSDHQGLLLRPV